jgi:hypothetical protein
MTTVHASVREVSEVPQRALVVAGIPPGAARRAAAMVAFAEIQHETGFGLLLEQLALPEDAPSTLLAGPSAVELAVEEAHRTGLGVAWEEGLVGAPLLDEPAIDAAAQGLLVVVAGMERTLVAAPDPDGHVAVLEPSAPSALHALAAAGAGGLPTGASALLELAARPAAERSVPGIAVVCVPADGATMPAGARVSVRRERAERHRAACEDGVAVRESEWLGLWARSELILVAEATGGTTEGEDESCKAT